MVARRLPGPHVTHLCVSLGRGGPGDHLPPSTEQLWLSFRASLTGCHHGHQLCCQAGGRSWALGQARASGAPVRSPPPPGFSGCQHRLPWSVASRASPGCCLLTQVPRMAAWKHPGPGSGLAHIQSWVPAWAPGPPRAQLCLRGARGAGVAFPGLRQSGPGPDGARGLAPVAAHRAVCHCTVPERTSRTSL